MCNYTTIHTSTQTTIPACIWDMSLMGNFNYPTLDCKPFRLSSNLDFLKAKRQATRNNIEIHSFSKVVTSAIHYATATSFRLVPAITSGSKHQATFNSYQLSLLVPGTEFLETGVERSFLAEETYVNRDSLFALKSVCRGNIPRPRFAIS